MTVESPSGGNQQKVVIGRRLATKRKLLICEDPTSGVDGGAKAEIYAQLNRAMEQGVGVIIVSTDFAEVASRASGWSFWRRHWSACSWGLPRSTPAG